MAEPVAAKALTLASAAAGWIVTNTKSETRYNVAKYYESAAIELEEMDTRVGKFVTGPFQKALAVEDKLCFPLERDVLALVQEVYTVLFMVMDLVLSYDERVRNMYRIGRHGPGMASRINRKLSMFKNVTKKKIAGVGYLTVDEYIQIWEQADRKMLNLFKVVPRRYKLIAFQGMENGDEKLLEPVTWKILENNNKIRQIASAPRKRKEYFEKVLKYELEVETKMMHIFDTYKNADVAPDYSDAAEEAAEKYVKDGQGKRREYGNGFYRH